MKIITVACLSALFVIFSTATISAHSLSAVEVAKLFQQFDYAEFQSYFTNTSTIKEYDYTRYDLDYDDEIPLSPLCASVKVYPKATFQTADSLYHYIITIRHMGVTDTFEDILFTGDAFKLLPRKQLIVLGLWTEQTQSQPNEQSYWIDEWDKTIHICTRNLQKIYTDTDVPYTKEYNRTYDITIEKLVIKAEYTDTVYHPQTYKQFDKLFDKSNARFGANKFALGDGADVELNNEILVVRDKKINHHGYNLYFFTKIPVLQAPWNMEVIDNSAYVTIYNPEEPEEPVEVHWLGSSWQNDSRGETYDYNFNEDGELIINNVDILYEGDTYFKEEIYIASSHSLRFKEGLSEERENVLVINSRMLNAEELLNIDHAPAYPTPDNECWLHSIPGVSLFVGFYIDWVEEGKPCFCFMTASVDMSSIIDTLSLCPEGVNVSSLPAKNTEKLSITDNSVDIIIETSEGRIKVSEDGTLRRM